MCNSYTDVAGDSYQLLELVCADFRGSARKYNPGVTVKLHTRATDSKNEGKMTFSPFNSIVSFLNGEMMNTNVT